MKLKLIFIFLIIFSLLFQIHSQEFSQIGITNDGGLRLRESYSLESEIITTLREGTKLRILNDQPIAQVLHGFNGNWIKVSTINGLYGWVYDQWVDILSGREYYTEETRFNTLHNYSCTTEKSERYENSIYLISIIVNNKDIPFIQLNKYVGNVLLKSTNIDIVDFKNYSHFGDYSYEKFIDFIILGEDDLVISCMSATSNNVFRIKNDSILWNFGYEIGTYSSEPKMTVDSEENIYIVQEHRNNFDKSNFDLYITKIDSDGNVLIMKDLRTPKWDEAISLSCIDDNIFIIGAFNGLHNNGIIKLDLDLNLISSVSIKYPNNTFSSHKVINDDNNLYITGLSGSVRNNDYMPVCISSISKDLEINWSYSLKGNNYNADINMKTTNNGIQLLGNSRYEYSYSLDNDKKAFWVLEYDDIGNRIDERHFLLPISVNLGSFESFSDRFIFFGNLPYYWSVYDDENNSRKNNITKIGFNFTLKKEEMDNNGLIIEHIFDDQQLVDSSNQILISNINVPKTDLIIRIDNAPSEYINMFPWNQRILDDAIYYPLSER
jgi:Bacterial SH3 domain